MTQECFAQELGVTASTINRWEHGKAKPNLTAMKNLKLFCEKHSLDYGLIETAWFDTQQTT
jgi:DNA-binding transcriptional regulator YiaG